MRGREVVKFLKSVEFWLVVAGMIKTAPGSKETAFAFHQRVKNELVQKSKRTAVYKLVVAQGNKNLIPFKHGLY